MSKFFVNIPFEVVWQFRDFPHYQVTPCKKVINTKTNTILKYHPRGFFINGQYLKRNQLNKHLEVIPKKHYCPF